MKSCPRLAGEGKLTRTFWDQFRFWLDGELRSLRIAPGPGLAVQETPGGQALKILGSGGGGGSVAGPFPFEIYQVPNADATDTTSVSVKVRRGLLNSVGQSNPNEIFVIASDVSASLWIEATLSVALTVATVSSMSISLYEAGSEPTIDHTSTTQYFKIGDVVNTTGNLTITQYLQRLLTGYLYTAYSGATGQWVFLVGSELR